MKIKLLLSVLLLWLVSPLMHAEAMPDASAQPSDGVGVAPLTDDNQPQSDESVNHSDDEDDISQDPDPEADVDDTTAPTFQAS